MLRALNDRIFYPVCRRRRGRRLVVVSAKLDDALLGAVEAAAEERGVSLSAFIGDALSARFGCLKKKPPRLAVAGAR